MRGDFGRKQSIACRSLQMESRETMHRGTAKGSLTDKKKPTGLIDSAISKRVLKRRF